MPSAYNQKWNPQHSLITGASSGLGAGLAQGLSAPGKMLTLTARRAEQLNATAHACRDLGATVVETVADVRDREAMHEIVQTADQTQPLDLVIANAGIGGGPGITPEDVYAVNMDGVRHTVEPALAVMEPRCAGQIAIMSSLAGFRGMPSAPAYAASKAFARAYGEGLETRYRGSGIAISVICPGFVTTPMTAANPFPMPFLMPEEKARAIMLRGLAKRRARIAFPWPTYAFCALLPILPASLVNRLLGGQASKE